MSHRAPLPAGAIPGTPYLIQELLAEGGFALVYLAIGPRGRVVIKELFHEDRCRRRTQGSQLEPLDGQGAIHERQKQRCREEWARFHDFRHPHIVELIDYFETNNTCYMVMPFVEGESLLDRVLRRPLSLDELLTLVEPLADALDALHGFKVMHRDVKPDNIWIRAADGQPLLLDTGAARSLERSRRGGTRLQTMLGAPELRGAAESNRYGQVGPATDVFALAGVCAFALSGQEPPDATLRDLNSSSGQDPLVNWRLPAPEAMAHVIRAGMALKVVDRLQSPGAFARALLDAHEHGTVPAHPLRPGPAAAPISRDAPKVGGNQRAVDWCLAGVGNVAVAALSSLLTPEEPLLGIAVFLVLHMASVLVCAHHRTRLNQRLQAMDVLPVANLLLRRGGRS